MTFVKDHNGEIIITSNEKKVSIEVAIPHVGECKIKACPFCGRHDFSIASYDTFVRVIKVSEPYIPCLAITCSNCEMIMQAEDSSISKEDRSDYAKNFLWLVKKWNHRARK